MSHVLIEIIFTWSGSVQKLFVLSGDFAEIVGIGVGFYTEVIFTESVFCTDVMCIE